MASSQEDIMTESSGDLPKKTGKYPDFPRVSWNTAEKADNSQQYVGIRLHGGPPESGDFDELDAAEDMLDSPSEFYDTPR